MSKIKNSNIWIFVTPLPKHSHLHLHLHQMNKQHLYTKLGCMDVVVQCVTCLSKKEKISLYSASFSGARVSAASKTSCQHLLRKLRMSGLTLLPMVSLSRSSESSESDISSSSSPSQPFLSSQPFLASLPFTTISPLRQSALTGGPISSSQAKGFIWKRTGRP